MSPKRRSMVVDPPDGRVPVMKWAEDKRDYDLAHLEDAPWHETPWVRCITRGVPAGMFPAGYNNAYQIIQIPGYVVIASEMIHDTRIVGRCQLPLETAVSRERISPRLAEKWASLATTRPSAAPGGPRAAPATANIRASAAAAVRVLQRAPVLHPRPQAAHGRGCAR